MKIKQLENKNQFVIFGDNGEIEFQSYDSLIARIDKKGILELSNRWDYSKTTLKHFYIFLDEYFSFLGDFTQKLFGYEFNNSKNKRAYIQKLIDNGKIFITLEY